MNGGPVLAYSSLGLPPAPIPEWCDLLAAHGFEGVEIALSPEHVARRADAAYWREARDAAASFGLIVTALHLGNPRLYEDPAAPRLLHPDPAERAKHRRLLEAAFEIAGRIGAPLVCGAVGTAGEFGTRDAEAGWARLLGEMRAALAAKPDDAELLMEPEPEHFLRTTDDAIRLHAETDGRVGCTFDVGHAHVAGEPIGDAIRRLGAGRLCNVHLEDMKDRVHRHLLPGDGELDFEEIGEALRAIGYAGPLAADLYPFADAPEEALKRASKTFGKLKRSAEKI